MTDNISWLQYLVMAKSLLLASKGPATDFLEAQSRRQPTDGESCDYLRQDFKKKILKLGRNILFYLVQTKTVSVAFD